MVAAASCCCCFSWLMWYCHSTIVSSRPAAWRHRCHTLWVAQAWAQAAHSAARPRPASVSAARSPLLKGLPVPQASHSRQQCQHPMGAPQVRPRQPAPPCGRSMHRPRPPAAAAATTSAPPPMRCPNGGVPGINSCRPTMGPSAKPHCTVAAGGAGATHTMAKTTIGLQFSRKKWKKMALR